MKFNFLHEVSRNFDLIINILFLVVFLLIWVLNDLEN